AIVGHLAVSNDEIAVLENERSRAEHFRLIGILGINGDVGDGARAKMSAIREPEELGGSGTGHRGDLGERIFASYRLQRRHLLHLWRQDLDPARSQLPIHEQSVDAGAWRSRGA